MDSMDLVRQRDAMWYLLQYVFTVTDGLYFQWSIAALGVLAAGGLATFFICNRTPWPICIIERSLGLELLSGIQNHVHSAHRKVCLLCLVGVGHGCVVAGHGWQDKRLTVVTVWNTESLQMDWICCVSAVRACAQPLWMVLCFYLCFYPWFLTLCNGVHQLLEERLTRWPVLYIA